MTLPFSGESLDCIISQKHIRINAIAHLCAFFIFNSMEIENF